MTYDLLSMEIIGAIQDVLGCPNITQPVALHEPYFKDTNALPYIQDCLDTGWVSTAGKWVSRFEDELASFTGAKYAIAVTNGTVGLRLALHLVGVQANHEVLTTPLSFVATANAVSHCNAVPHFVDIDPVSLGMDPTSLTRQLQSLAKTYQGKVYNKYTGRRISAILPVHVFGHPCNISEICEVAAQWGLPVVEDSAEALGSRKSNKHCGLFGSVGVVSFNGNKLITTGGGGALLTDDQTLAERARHLSTTAKLAHPWAFEHDEIAWNDRMPNINAALGVAQLELIKQRIQAKRDLAMRYHSRITRFKDLEIIHEPADCSSNYWLISLRLTHASRHDAMQLRNSLLKIAHSHNIFIRPVWKPLHQLSIYASSPRQQVSVTEDQAMRILNLPSSPQLL